VKEVGVVERQVAEQRSRCEQEAGTPVAPHEQQDGRQREHGEADRPPEQAERR
jgi:hypothetical protein